MPKQQGTERNLGHFRLSEQHADDCLRLSGYDFLLAFCSDLRSAWNRCRCQQNSNSQEQEKERLGVFIETLSIRDAAIILYGKVGV